MTEKSPPPSFYEPPVFNSCLECGIDVKTDDEETLCPSCIADIRAEQAYNAMIDNQFDPTERRPW